MDVRLRSQDNVSSQVITDRTFRRKESPCNIEGCRSTWYRWDLERGFAICRNGHEHPEMRMQVAAEDIFEVIRGDRVTKKRERVVMERIQLEGEDALELYLLAWQLVLRVQVRWLIEGGGLGVKIDEFERLVRELWGLRLDSLVRSGRLRADAGGAVGSTAASSSGGETSEDDRTFYSSQDFSSSQEEENSDGSSRRSAASRRWNQRITFASTPKLVDTVALCSLTCLILQLPVNLADFLDWVQEGKLLYYRAILAVPRDMRDRMASNDQHRLDPDNLLTASQLQQAVAHLAIGFQCETNIILPALNYPLHAFRIVHTLTLPIHVYSAIKALNKLLDIGFRYPNNRKRRYKVVDYPEYQLLALIVIATKLLYPFDDLKRFPIKKDEAAVMAMDWETWAWTREYGESKRLNKSPTEQALSYSEAMHLSERDIDYLSDAQMDSYLEFYSTTFGRDQLRTRDRDIDFRQYLLDLFPVKSAEPMGHPSTQPSIPPQEATASTPDTSTVTAPSPPSPPILTKQASALSTVLSSLKIRPTITIEQAAQRQPAINTLRPGDEYARYRNVEELEAGGGYAELFYRETAKVGGVDFRALVRAVYQVETLMEKWARGEWLREKEEGIKGGGEEQDGVGSGSGRRSKKRSEADGKGKG